jgi:hypothetical protein
MSYPTGEGWIKTRLELAKAKPTMTKPHARISGSLSRVPRNLTSEIAANVKASIPLVS